MLNNAISEHGETKLLSLISEIKITTHENDVFHTI